MYVARGDQYSQPSKSAYKPVSSWFFPHPIAWIACAFLIAVETIWIPLAGFTISFGDLWKQFAFAVVFAMLAMGLSRQGWHRLAIFAFTTAFFIFFGKQGNVLNYLSHGLGFPWADSGLAQLEQAMGFDWLAHLAWINDHPEYVDYLWGPYNLLKFYSVLTILCLLLLSELEKLREFVMVFAISVIITIVIGAMFPAGGTYHFYKPVAELHSHIPAGAGRFFLPHLIAVHDGTLKAIPLDRVVGLITFPSYHMVMALITTWATRRTVVFPIFVFFNLLMILAIPVFGGHYLPDLIGGLGVAVFSVWIYRRWSGYRSYAQEKGKNMSVLQNESVSGK